jgi:hypothetical protein
MSDPVVEPKSIDEPVSLSFDELLEQFGVLPRSTTVGVKFPNDEGGALLDYDKVKHLVRVGKLEPISTRSPSELLLFSGNLLYSFGGYDRASERSMNSRYFIDP